MAKRIDIVIRGKVKYIPDYQNGYLEIPFQAQTFDFEGKSELGEKTQEVLNKLKGVPEVLLKTPRKPDIKRGDSLTVNSQVEILDDFSVLYLTTKFNASKIDVIGRDNKKIATYYQK